MSVKGRYNALQKGSSRKGVLPYAPATEIMLLLSHGFEVVDLHEGVYRLFGENRLDLHADVNIRRVHAGDDVG